MDRIDERFQDWYFALCQHPMYLIIEEDETAAERTPPWGEPDIETYIERIRRNLDALNRYPQLKFNYDFSGVELERLAGRAPDVVAGMRRFIGEGRVGFVNGNYAQAHLHTLGSESNIRQLKEGLAAIERITGYRVRTYAHQEPAIHDQMPQLLNALGYEYAVTPGFIWVISFLDPHEILGAQYQGLRFIQGEDFTSWQGLDGSTIPLYLTQPRILPKGGPHGSESHRRALRNEYVKDKIRYSPVRVDFPDMVDIDDEWIEDHAGHEYVVLDEILERRAEVATIGSRARLYTYWGYGEGMEAELLHRTNRRAETALVEAGNLDALAGALLGHGGQIDLSEDWRRFLAAEHHDAYWVAGAGLRARAVSWARASTEAAEAAAERARGQITAAVDTELAGDGQPLVVCEPWPLPRRDVVVAELEFPEGEADGITVFGPDGEEAPAQVVEAELHADGSLCRCQVAFVAETEGFGYQTFAAAASRLPQTNTEQVSGARTFEGPGYRTTVEPDGTFSSLRLRQGGEELLDTGRYRGNLLRGTAGVGGDWIEFVPEGAPQVRRGPVCDIFEVAGRIDRSPTSVRLTFYHGLPRIDVRLAFSFDEAEIGDFWIDESKLNVYWPVRPRGEIWHDIPFGAVQGRESRAFFGITWVRLGNGRGGLALFNRGTVRYWIEDNVLANVIACGVQGRDIGTRARPELFIKDFDLRLSGGHVIEYAVYPHQGSWQEAGVVRQAHAYQHPLRAAATDRHPGTLPLATALFHLQDHNLVPTALWAGEQVGTMVCRLFESYGRETKVQVGGDGRLAGLRRLDGAAADAMGAFKVGEASVTRRGKVG